MFEIMIVGAVIFGAIAVLAIVAKLVFSLVLLPFQIGILFVKGLFFLVFGLPLLVLSVALASIVLPIAAVIGRSDIMDLYPPGSMTSTHSASPLPVAAAVANVKLILAEKLPERAAALGELMMPRLAAIQKKYPGPLGCLQGKGLVAGLQVVKPGTKTPDSDTALRINEKCFHKGVLMFAPVGVGGECLKISPPLVITEDALLESLDAFGEACDEVLGK